MFCSILVAIVNWMVSNSRISSRAEIAVFSVNLVSRVFYIGTRRFSIKHPLVSIFLNVIQTCIHEKLNHWQRRKVAFFETLNGFSCALIKSKWKTADVTVFKLLIFLFRNFHFTDFSAVLSHFCSLNSKKMCPYCLNGNYNDQMQYRTALPKLF